jgi:WD40-like Beta Propeller Repeat
VRKTSHSQIADLASGSRWVAAWGVVWVCTLSVLLALMGASAQAAVTHEFLSEPSKGLTEGAPASSGAALTGPLSVVQAMSVDSGHLWLTGHLAGTGSDAVDKFNDATGAFLTQLNVQGSVTSFGWGIAVGHGTGEEEVYVGAGKEGAPAVAVFGPSGSLQAAWSGTATPDGSFGSEVTGVAVDKSTNTLEDGAVGDVYVGAGGAGANVVDVFKPEAGGGEPAKVVARLTGTCKAAHEACAGAEVVPFTRLGGGVAVSALDGEVLVVDKEQIVDVFKPGAIVGEYEFVGALTGPPNGTFKEITGVAVDGGNGDIYVAEHAALATVYEFTSAGAYAGRLTGAPAAPFKAVQSVAVDPESHDVYVSDFNPIQLAGALDVFGPNIVIPDVVTGPATEVKPRSAVLNGIVNPDKEGEVSCRFVYGTTRAFGSEAKCSKTVPEGSSPVSVQATLEGVLEPDTTYYYRLQATNKNGTNVGSAEEDQEFTTGGPGLRGESVSSVSATAATLEATIDPHNAPLFYYFEYGVGGEYGSRAPIASEVSAGSGAQDVEAVQHVQGLRPGTLYHYRVVAVGEVAGKLESFAGPDRTFTTQLSASGFALPDGRRWEMVSPPDKHGALINALGESISQAAASGDAMTYDTTAPTEEGTAGFSNFVQVMSVRGPEGWISHDIAMPHRAATGVGGSDYRVFSEDLSLGAAQPFGNFTPAVSPAGSEQTAYLRTDFRSGEPTAFCVEDCYRPLVTGCPPVGEECPGSVQEAADVPSGTKFGEEGNCANKETKQQLCGPEVVVATPDLSHVVLSTHAALEPGAKSDGGDLYEWEKGALTPVNVLENGTWGGTPVIGYQNIVVRHAISDDGSRIVWSEGERHIYVRDMSTHHTVQLDVPQGGSGEGTVTPRFQTASADGTKVFFTDNQQLTEDAGGGSLSPTSGDLYECEIVEAAGELKCDLSDLTPKESDGGAADVLGTVIGASEDGSWIYFVADGALTPEAERGVCTGGAQFAPPSATCNLYVWHDGVTKLVAKLSAADYHDWAGSGSTFLAIRELTARVSPDGRWLAFQSRRGLTGYDNRDARTGEPDEEVYVYDADSGKILCASCDPTGARPAGIRYGEMTNPALIGNQIWSPNVGLAASLPGWTTYGIYEALYQSRYLSDNGRTFFNSSDALVPKDVNGVGDVYEFEPPGVGDCSATSVTYSALSGGCVNLVSSGSAGEEAGFLDASATGGRDAEGHEGGGDVFFLTVARLSPADFDSSPDVYDAHECSRTAPCLAPPPVSPPSCATGDACKPAPTPQPPIFGSPASATFTGAGNLAPPVAAATPRSKPLTRAQKLAAALKACKRTKARSKRVACERRARRRQGTQAKRSNRKGRS